MNLQIRNFRDSFRDRSNFCSLQFIPLFAGGVRGRLKIINIMKTLKYKIQTLLIVVLIGFSSCAIDEETVIVPKDVATYQLQMQQFVDSQLIFVNNCVVGYNKNDFKTTTNYTSYKTAYLTALTAAQTVLKKTDLTIPEIVAANKTLGTPGKNFTGSLWISDRRALNDSIVSAETFAATIIVGTAVGQVAETSKTEFTAAITAAKATRGASAAIDRQVLEAIVKLEDAEKVFKGAIVK